MTISGIQGGCGATTSIATPESDSSVVYRESIAIMAIILKKYSQ